MKIRCPFHEDNTASLHIYEDGYHCFGCGASGPLDRLPAQYRPQEVPVKYVENVERTVSWIKSLPKKTIRGLNLHCSTDHYFIVWPDGLYYVRRGFIDVPGRGKYKAPSGHARPLLIASHGPQRQLAIVEGEINALSIAAVYPNLNIVSPGGAGDFYSKHSEKNLNYYRLFDKISLIVDKDPAGAKAAIELKSKLLQYGLEVTISLWEQDANDILMQYGKEGLKKQIQQTLEMPDELPGNSGTVCASGSLSSQYRPGDGPADGTI